MPPRRPQTGTRNNPMQLDFDEEDLICQFVQRHQILYHRRHPRFRDRDGKNMLWLRLAVRMHKDVNVIKKRWQSMRDYFVRTWEQKNEGSRQSFSERDQRMTFLLGSIMKHPIKPEPEVIDHRAILNELFADYRPNDHDGEQATATSTTTTTMDATTTSTAYDDDDTMMEFVFDDEYGDYSSASRTDSSTIPEQPSTADHTLTSSTTTSSEHPADRSQPTIAAPTSSTSENPNQWLHGILERMPVPATAAARGDHQHVYSFFDAMADTVGRLPAPTVARVKMEIARMVGEAELECLQNGTLQSER